MFVVTKKDENWMVKEFDSTSNMRIYVQTLTTNKQPCMVISKYNDFGLLGIGVARHDIVEVMGKQGMRFN